MAGNKSAVHLSLWLYQLPGCQQPLHSSQSCKGWHSTPVSMSTLILHFLAVSGSEHKPQLTDLCLRHCVCWEYGWPDQYPFVTVSICSVCVLCVSLTPFHVTGEWNLGMWTWSRVRATQTQSVVSRPLQNCFCLSALTRASSLLLSPPMNSCE